MSTVAMTGSDSFKLNNRILNDLADGDCVVLSFDNDIANLKTGKNGNSLYALNETGNQAGVIFKLVRGSADDKFFNNLLATQQQNFAAFPLMFGEFIKRVGDGLGNVSKDTYIMSGGIFKKLIPAKSNVEGDTEQSISEYALIFSNAPRVIT